jgi:solute carrier family 24 (sodium/potassium/calcium exchanger), member 6
MSEQLAGVTLLALANGAPDVIGALTAAGSDQGGVGLAVGGLTGAGLFITGVVTAWVVLTSPVVIKLNP